MTPSVKRVHEEVNKLSPLERVEVIDLILESFGNRPDKEVEEA